MPTPGAAGLMKEGNLEENFWSMSMSTKTRSKSLAFLTAPVCAMLLGLMANGALAQSSATVSVPIRLTVGAISSAALQMAPVASSELDGCTFSSAGINFGAVSGSSLKIGTLPARNSVQGSLTITCPSAVQLGSFGIQVGLDSGANGAAVAKLRLPKGSTAVRAMSHGNSAIAYDLYKPVVSAGLFLTGLAPAPTPAASAVRHEWGDVAQQVSSAGTCDIPGSSNLGSLFCMVDEGGDGLAFTLSSPVLMTVPFSGSGDITIPIVATIPGGQVQSLPPGLYTDTITVTLLFF
jgi:spore coat protein U-like protein